MRAVRLVVLWSLFTAPAVAQPPEPELPADQQRAATVIERLGGSVSRDSRVAGHPVTGVSFDDPITDADLELIAAFPSLLAM